MRWAPLVLNLSIFYVVFLTGCTSVPKETSTVDERVIVEFSVSMDKSKNEAIIQLSIENQSEYKICLVNDLLKNPSSYAMNIDMKDSRGKSLKKIDFGLVPPPVPGETQLEHGRKIQASYNLGERFGLERLRKDTSQYRAMTQFNYWRCVDRSWRSAKSSWKTFRYPIRSN